MAARRHRRRRRVAAAPRRRRRHHRRRVMAINPPRRRRRRRFIHGHRTGTRRRRRSSFRHNPPGGLIGGVLQGAKDGTAVVVGQVANRKIVGAVNGAFKSLPTTPTVKIAVTVAAAVGVSVAARQLLRGAMSGYSRFIAAGAFSEAINCALAQTPIAPYLGAYNRRVVRTTGMGAIGPASPRVRGYVQPAAVGAYTQPRVPVAGQVS